MRSRHLFFALERYVVIVYLLLASGTNSEPICRKGCISSDNGILQYTAGNVYEYDFESVLSVDLNSQFDGSDETSLKVSGAVKLFFEGNCGYTLQLSTIRVQAFNESIEKKITQSIQKPVHFSIVSGKIQPELCTETSDTSYAINIKRAIISLLHTSIDVGQPVSEVDVFGQCPTQTSVSKIGGAKIITKVRNLNSCLYREQFLDGILNGVVNEKAGVKSSMLLQADYVKESKLEKGILKNVHSVEVYKFTSGQKSGPSVHAKVSTTLKLKEVTARTASLPAAGNYVQSIIFQNPEPNVVHNIIALKNALSQTVESVNEYVQKNAGKNFVELIQLMRNADMESLLELATFSHSNKVLTRKVYLDALFRTGTSESTKAILKQLNEMDEKEKKIAFLSMNLVASVDKEILNAAAAILGNNSPNEVYLAVGTLISKYCQQKTCNQGEIDFVYKKFIDALKHCKANTKKDEERILNVLKGLRNTQNIIGRTAQELVECAATGHSARVRVATLQAFSAAACEPLLQKKALELLRNSNEDSELRIEAYLAAISCPNAELANEIADIVNSEKVNQVGGFIVSSLKAIRDSTDATRESQRYHLANIRVIKNFPKDYRRYSFNNELSYKLSDLGLSASADYRLIYSQQGFIPRSARLNVTTEIFGVNYNVFEASIRQENIENILEYYLGPKGLLNKNFDEIMQIIQSGGVSDRVRRSIVDETNKFAKKYKNYGAANVHDLNLDLSLKLFGSEMIFLSLGDSIPDSLEDIISYFSTILDEAKKGLSSYSKKYNMHTLFEDSKIICPTGIGFPLELSTQGFAANSLDFGIEFDVDSLLQQTWQQSKYRLKIVPSTDVSFNAKLGFNAYVLSTGARINLNGHSAIGSDARLEFNDGGNGFNLDIELPREKLNLIDLALTADFFILESGKETKSIALKSLNEPKEKTRENCLHNFDSIGLNICVSTNFPDTTQTTTLKQHNTKQREVSERLYLGRPFTFTLHLMSERKVNIKGKYEPHTSNGSQQWKLNYSTPGSKVSHNTDLIFELGIKPYFYGRFSFDNQNKHFALEAGVKNDIKEMVLYGQYEYNNDIKKNKIGFKKNGNAYHPIIEFQDRNGVYNDINGYRVDGKVIVQAIDEKQTRYKFENFEVVNDKNEHIIVSGWTDVGPVFFNTELNFASGQEKYFIKSNFKIGNDEYCLGFFINNERSPENIAGGSALIKVKEKEIYVDVLCKALAWVVESKTEIGFEKSERKNAINFTKLKSEFFTKNKNTIVASIKLNGITESQNKLEVDVEVLIGTKFASFDIKLIKNQRSPGDYQLDTSLKINKHFVQLMATCDIKGNIYSINNVLTTSWGALLTCKGDLGQRFTLLDVLIDLQGSVQLNEKQKLNQWMFKVIGIPEKTISEFKLFSDNIEFIKYAGELQHPQDKITIGKINLQVKNTLSSSADFKLAKNGKGELTASIETFKTDKKHKVEVHSKFHTQAPKYDIETTIKLDAENIVYFKTENIIEKLKFLTKTITQINDKKITFDANAVVKGDWRVNGEVQSSFSFTSPSDRIIGCTLKQKATTNPKTSAAHYTAELQVNDQLPINKLKRRFSLNGRLETKKIRELESELNAVFTNFQGEKVEVIYNLKHLPKGQYQSIDSNLNVQGDLVKKPIEFTFNIDEYSSNHANFHIYSKFGNYGTAKLNGKYSFNISGNSATYAIENNVQIPQSTFKTFEIKSNGLFSKTGSENGIGSYAAEIYVDEKIANNQFMRLNAILKSNRKRGAYSLEFETENMKGPLKLQGHYDRNEDGGQIKDNASFNLTYKFDFKYSNIFINSAANISYYSLNRASINYVLDSSFENAKGIDIFAHGQKLDDDSIIIKIKGTESEKTFTVELQLFGAAHKKGLNLHATLPNANPILIVGVYEQLGERKVKLFLDVENLFKLDFKGSLEAYCMRIDDFFITAELNSAKLSLDNFTLNVRSKDGTISLELKNAQGVILALNTAYALKTEKNKSILEGQGQFKYNGKTQNANFRIINQHFELATDKEVGFSITFNGNFGPKNSVSTLKITNKDFNIKFSVCEEKKQCTNIQVQSIATIDEYDKSYIQHFLLVLIDLRSLGYPHEFEVQSKSIKQGLNFQYSLESSLTSNNNIKYQLIINLLQSTSKILVKLPSREILLETQQTLPPQGTIFGQYKNSITFYFDKKNKPNDVMRLVASADISGAADISLDVQSQVKFEHPSIRPLSISSKLNANRQQNLIVTEIVFDTFRLPEQKIIVKSNVYNTPINNGFNVTYTQEVHSSGLEFQLNFNGYTALDLEKQEFSVSADLHSGASDLKANVLIFGNKDHFKFLVNSMGVQILQLVSDFNRQKYISKLKTKLQVYGQKDVELTIELQPSLAAFSLVQKGLLESSAEIYLSKGVKFHVIGAGKQLYSGSITYDSEKFLQSEYASNEGEIKTFLKTLEIEIQKQSKVVDEKTKKWFQKATDAIDMQIQLAKESCPDLLPLKSNIENNIDHITKELENDESLKQIIGIYRNFYITVAKIVGVVAKTALDCVEKLLQTFDAVKNVLKSTIKDSILPVCKEFAVAFSKLLGELFAEIINLHSKIIQSVLDILEKYRPALKIYGKAFMETMKPFNEAVQELYKVILHVMDQFLEEFKELISKLPNWSEVRGWFKEMKLIKKLLVFVKNMFIQLHALPLTPEINDFLQKIQEYIDVKLKEQPLDDRKFIDELINAFVKALQSILPSFQVNSDNGIFTNGLGNLFSILPVSVDMISKVPTLFSLRLSIFNFVLNEEWDNVFTKDWLKSWLLFHNFELDGHVANGRYIFTFDGQLVIFPGSCKYILAQDSFDNNFTIIAQLSNGKLKNIILSDRDGGYAEINDGGMLRINGSASEYPQRTESLHVWREFYTIWLKSEYGVQVMCSSDLKICHINIDGFYTSKTRGLLGNGNAEPSDDFIKADGTIAANSADFGNGYGLGKCNQVATTETVDKKHNEICNEIFGINSPLALGYLSMDAAPFRHACDDAVFAANEKDKEYAACTIAANYGSALKMKNFMIMLPPRCLKCAGSVGQRDLGQEFIVKIPNNKADIVFVIDTAVTTVALKNLINPLIHDVREALKIRGLTDVQIVVVAFNENQRYPAVLTSDNGKLNYQGNINEVKLNGPKRLCDDCISQVLSDKSLTDLYNTIDQFFRSFYPQPDELAFELALNYPFRAGAAKSIVGVYSKSVENKNLLKHIRAHVAGTVSRFDGALLHMIAPIQELLLEGVPPEKLVGFNSRLVATLDGKDNKKRQKLQFKSDLGVNFVLNNGGWIFNTQHFDNLKPEDQKKALYQISSSIADTLFKTEIVSDCKCVSVNGLHAQHWCTIKTSAFIPNKKPKSS